MSAAAVLVWALVQVWFRVESDRVSITIHPTIEACKAAKDGFASQSVCLGPYEKDE